MNYSRLVRLGLVFGISIGMLVSALSVIKIGSVKSAGTPGGADVNQTSLMSAAPEDILSISDSNITTGYCYEPDKTQILCFTVHNGSIDTEWLDGIRMTFPHVSGLGDWNAACYVQDPIDSSGYPVNLTCQMAFDYEILFVDNDIEAPDNIGEITSGSSWNFCLNVNVPSGYDGQRVINWGLSGDEESGSAEPHDITGTLSIEQCMPLMLTPDAVALEGCNDTVQQQDFTIWNNTGSSRDISILYNVDSSNATFSGPTDTNLDAGGVFSFTTVIKPDFNLLPGDKVFASITVESGGDVDESLIDLTISKFDGWEELSSSPNPSMDNVVVWASHEDGGLWSIGGYGSGGTAQRYDPVTDSWSVHTSEIVITPTIEYPMDGCYGLNAAGEEIVVLFPDTIITDTLHIYNITKDAWYAESVPAFYPLEGRWGQDIVSLLNNPSVKPDINKNACYLSGGSTQEGGGRTRDLWVYYPAYNNGAYLKNFPADIWFNFHASWYVPWVGTKGAVCVGGGIDQGNQVNDTTQCYDLEKGIFNSLNVDLGSLPEPWWGMADGWQVDKGQYQIWIANGVAQNGTLLPTSAYTAESMGGFAYGPPLPVALYRLEGDGWDGDFFTLMGAQGGFIYSSFNQHLERCPSCQRLFLPLTVRS